MSGVYLTSLDIWAAWHFFLLLSFLFIIMLPYIEKNATTATTTLAAKKSKVIQVKLSRNI